MIKDQQFRMEIQKDQRIDYTITPIKISKNQPKTYIIINPYQNKATKTKL